MVEPSFGVSRDKLQSELMKRGVETRAFFIPMNKQPVFRDMGLYSNETYPIAEDLSEKGLYLPSSSGLTKDEIVTVCRSIVDIGKNMI